MCNIMDKITQYYKLTNIKPDYYTLNLPYYVATKKRIVFNGKELELHYVNEFGVYAETEAKAKAEAKDERTKGGATQKITIVDM